MGTPWTFYVWTRVDKRRAGGREGGRACDGSRVFILPPFYSSSLTEFLRVVVFPRFSSRSRPPLSQLHGNFVETAHKMYTRNI